MKGKGKSIHLGFPSELVFSVLADYNSYEHWVPGILSSRVLEREGDIAVAEFTASDYFAAKFFSSRRFQLEFVASGRRSLRYSQIDRFRSGLSGQWLVEEGGTESVIVSHRMWVKGSILKSVFFHPGIRAATSGMLAGLAARAGTIAAGPLAAHGGRRKILEVVVRGPRSIEAWFAGEVYDLVKREGQRR